MSQPTIRKQRIRRSSVKVRLIVFGTLAVLLILFSVFSEQLTPYDPYLQDLSNAKAPPSAEHLLGTDRYGRDMLSRVIVGSRTSIFSTLLLVAVITVLGTAVGIFCGWNGRWMDTVLMRISDMFLAFPGLVFALAVAGSLGGGLQNASIALAAISWPKYARIARSQTLAQKETVWMRAAKLSGSSSGKLIFKHILPNIIGPILVTAMLDIGTMMMELAALSFLGLGSRFLPALQFLYPSWFLTCWAIRFGTTRIPKAVGGEPMEELLRYDHVDISYNGIPAVQDVSFTLRPGEILGIVGESGCGKSTLLKAAMGLLGSSGMVTRGDIWYKGRNLPDLPARALRKLNGPELGMIFQSAGSSFCPIRTVGAQLYEIMTQHGSATKKEFENCALELLEKLGFEDGRRILRSYPFELSGGMQQRVGIAAAMLLRPGVLFADEPTAALDVSVQKQVLEELLLLRKTYGTAIVLVAHNIGVIGAMADRVLVMQDGRTVEYGETQTVLHDPQASYTRMLLSAVPRLRRA